MGKGRVGVVGSGIAGVSSAWALAKEGFEVTLLEAGDRLGGHSFTYPGDEASKRPPVDLGFQVFNLTTYPYLTSFFRELGVEHEPSDMSFALSVDGGKTEWASHNLGTIFAQKKNAASPSFLRMIREVLRFGKEAPQVLEQDSPFREKTLGEYLDANGYSERFRKEYLLPTCAAVWSVPNQQMTEFPVVPLIAFMANHHLLDVLGDRPRWRVCSKRSKDYVAKARESLERMGGSVRLNCAVKQVVKSAADAKTVQVVLEESGEELEFDHVVLACHSDTSAKLLEEGRGTAKELALVSKIRYQPNRVLLHTDERQMPRTKSAWASWNVLDQSSNGGPGRESEREICVTYWLNRLQNLPEDTPTLLCTLNPLNEVPKEKVIFETVLDHPVFDLEAIAAQKEINRLQAHERAGRNVWFAGAWLGSGFHEDGIRSAVAIATSLSADGVTPPAWARRVGAPEHPALQLIRGPSPGKTSAQSLGLRVFESLARRGIRKGVFRMVLPDGNDLAFGRASAAVAEARGEPVVTLQVNNLEMLWKTVSKSDIGLGEAYRDKMFETDDLTGLFRILIINSQSLREALDPMGVADSPVMGLLASGAYAVGNAIGALNHMLRDNTVAGSRKNIEEHYDLGNEMYKLFLDESMTYSCGIHSPEFGATDIPEGQKFLPQHEAQLAKLDAIIRRADLQPSDHVLEIGCGWGSFAIRAASTVGCKVTGITISTEQLAEAQARVKAAGLEDKVNLMICDYRKMGILQYNASKGAMMYDHNLAPGHFDKIVSIEMLEAVGHNHLPEYFETVERMLKRDGRAVIQVISIHDDRYAEYCSTSDFIRRFIFPGGHLPSLGAVKWATQETALDLTEVVDIGPDYAITLDLWQERFRENKAKIMALGYPETWYRVFDMYFSYCSAGFSEKYILDYHLTFVNRGKETDTASTEPVTADALAVRFGTTLMPAFMAFLAWVGILSLTTAPAARQTATVVFVAVLFGALMSTALPKLDPLMSTLKSREYRRTQSLMIRFSISAFVCVVVVALVAFHDVLYTTQLANSNMAMPALVPATQLGELDSHTVVSDTGSASAAIPRVNVSDDIHFCAWGGEEDEEQCQQTKPNASGNQKVDDSSAESQAKGKSRKYFMRSPMHFVVAVLAWCAATRFVLDVTIPNTLHAAAMLVLSILAYWPDTATATSALGLAIVHGVSELHASISAFRKITKQRGYTLAHSWYARLWQLDLFSLVLIRWVPVPFLLFPVILKAPLTVQLPIIAIALRETTVLVRSVVEYLEDKDNCVNTDQLLPEARSKNELINAMTKEEKLLAEPTPALHSTVYQGTVFHHRHKVEGASPAAHKFQYNVWMALINLEETQSGQAFKNDRFISANGKWNLFSWDRKDHFSGLDGESTCKPLDACIKSLVTQETGRTPGGQVLLLTNLRCFGFVFNPVSIYYCLNHDNSALDAVVLEVSNTPWLQKRMYVLPFFDQAASSSPQERQRLFASKWKKDFHVSPFFDRFYNYEWLLNFPGDSIDVKAISTRRPADAAEAGHNAEWEHKVGTNPTDFDVQDSGKTTFVAGLHLKRAAGSSIKQILFQPLMTFSIVLYIHIHAATVMWKGVDYKTPPKNSTSLGMMDLFRHLFVFTVALLYEIAMLPCRFAGRVAALFS